MEPVAASSPPAMVTNFRLNGAKDKLEVSQMGAKNKIRIRGTGFDQASVEFLVVCPGVSVYDFEFTEDPTATDIRGRFKAAGGPFLPDSLEVTVYVMNRYGALRKEVEAKVHGRCKCKD